MIASKKLLDDLQKRVTSLGDDLHAHMDGMDVYDSVKNSIEATKAGKVAAWFLDADYDGRTFCICQAFFPDKKAWEKLSKALSGSIDPEAFAAFSGTKCLPFHAGKHRRADIKVIDPRGNEVMRVHNLDGSYTSPRHLFGFSPGRNPKT